MSERNDERKPDAKVADRWWVETTNKQRIKPSRPAGPAGTSFFEAAHDFEQERARERLTDNNLKLLQQAGPPEGAWAHVGLAETQFPARELERIKQMIVLPKFARGLIADSGRSIRILLTGTPIGERILELTLGECPSFDCWVEGDWVREEVFDDVNRAVRAFRALVNEYLSPEGIRHSLEVRAHA
jgi:hypothetical protein